jgi:hypothetical protein
VAAIEILERSKAAADELHARQAVARRTQADIHAARRGYVHHALWESFVCKTGLCQCPVSDIKI